MKGTKKKNDQGHRATRRRNKEIVSKMIRNSTAYIAVMWDGRDPNPMTVIDIAPLNGVDAPIAKAFLEIAKFAAAQTRLCEERSTMNTAQVKQSQLAESIRAARSATLAAAADNESPNGADENPPVSVNGGRVSTR